MTRTVRFMFLYHLTCFSMANACFTMVDTCPDTKEKWTKRSNEYNCISGRFYTCLMNDNMTLAEACIYPHSIEATREGCPVFALCTEEYGPMIDNELKPCAKGVYGCPSSNHSGYNLTEMFKFLGCFKHVVANRENEAAISQQRTTPTPSRSSNTDSSENEVLILKIVITCLSIPIILAIFFIVFLLVRHIQDNYNSRKDFQRKNDASAMNKNSYHKVQQTESNIKEEDSKDTCDAVLSLLDETKDRTEKEGNTMVDKSFWQRTSKVGIPSEVMHYLEEVDYKPVLSTFNLTTMALVSKAPKAIGLVGRLRFIANLTSFEIGIDSEEGKELRIHASALGENCKKCFTGAKDNFQSIIYSMSDVIEKLSTLSSMMKDDCMTEKESEMVIILITKNVDKCIAFCQKTETMFKHLGEYVEPFDRSLQSAKKKIDDKHHSGSEGKNDWHLNRVKSCLKNTSELIGKTSMLFEELGNNWEKITDFFVNMQLFLKGTVKNDIDLYLESLLSVQRVSYGQGTSIMVSMKGNEALQKQLLDILFAKASYVRIVSSFYVFVSSEIFAKCLQIITRSLYVQEQMTPTDIESSMERLQKICTDAEDHVLHLCKSIEQLIKR